MDRETKLTRAIIHLVLLAFSVVMAAPFVWMTLTSFMTVTEATSINPFVLWPSAWRTDAFESVFTRLDIPRLYLNTLLLIGGRIFFAVITATTAGYAFARLEFRGKKLAFGLILMQMMVPSQIFVIPQFLMVNNLGMQNTIFALIFPGLVTTFGTFLLTQAYKKLPKELEEAAILDGCNIGQTFLFIMMPLAKSSMVALGIFTAIFAYQDLLWPMIVNPNADMRTLAPALAVLQGQFANQFPELMAASLLASVPMITLYLIFQKQFVEGIANSGSKM